MYSFERRTLSNGTELILVPKKSSPISAIMVLVRVGSQYETKNINGVSHFLEHMMFKGTKNRPKAIDISSALDGLGAEYNAFTNQEFTSYYAKVQHTSFSEAAHIIADLYLNPTLPKEEIEKERGVIIEEINMYEDTPARRVQELFMQVLYGDQPAGWDIAGRKEVIRTLSRDDFLSYRNTHYISGNTILIIAGNYTPKTTKDIVRLFEQLPPQPPTPLPAVSESQKKPAELVQFKDSEQTHVVLGFRTCDIHDQRRFALEVLADILGGGMSSRLFQRIREQLGAAYYVSADADLYTNHGYLRARAGINGAKTEVVIRAVLEEFVRFREESIGDEELNRAKRHITGKLLLSLEAAEEIGYFYGMQIGMGLKPMQPQELTKHINAVTAMDIRAVANDFFHNAGLNFALIGPFKDKSFIDILKI